MATVNSTINDTLTQVQLRQIRQKVEEEKMMRSSDAGSTGVNSTDIKLQQAVIRRQELLDRIRNERNLRDDLMRRPASDSSRRKNKSPLMVSPRRAESQPPPLPILPQSKDSGYPRQVVEHQFKPMRLDPLEQTPKPPPIVHTSMPTPYLVNMPHMQPALPTNTKGEMMEMMMLQNAQMHQMIMNQMMMQAIPKPSTDNTRSNSRAFEPEERRRPPSVHHHHYDSPSPLQHHQQQPLVYTLPPVVGQSVGYSMYQSPMHYPAELEPLKQPKVKKKKVPTATLR